MYECRYKLVTAVSKKGSEYTRLEVTFSNGYVLKVFLNDEQLFCVKNAAQKDQNEAQ